LPNSPLLRLAWLCLASTTITACTTASELARSEFETQSLVADTNSRLSRITKDVNARLEAIEDRIGAVSRNATRLRTEEFASTNRLRSTTRDALASTRQRQDNTERTLGLIVGSPSALLSGNPGGLLGKIVDQANELYERENDTYEKVREIEDEAKSLKSISTQLQEDFRFLDDSIIPKLLTIESETNALLNSASKLDSRISSETISGEVSEYLNAKGLGDREISKLYQSFSIEEILALIGVGAGSVAASRLLSRSREQIEATETRLRSEIANQQR